MMQLDNNEHDRPARGAGDRSMEFGRLGQRSDHSRAGCLEESRTLLTLIDEALPLAKSAEDLLAMFDTDISPVSADARTGLQLRLGFVNLLGPLNDLRCCPEHTAIQSQAASLLTFYLHMITRSFEVRFSVLSREDYTILGRDYHASSSYLKLLGLRADLEDSLNRTEANTDGFWARDGSAMSIQPGGARFREAMNRRTLQGLAVVGALFVVASVVGAIWAQSASLQLRETCNGQVCEPSQPFLSMLTSVVQLCAPPLLAAGVIWVMVAAVGSRLLVAFRLRQLPTRKDSAYSARTRALTPPLVWVPGVALTALSVAAILYVSNSTLIPQALCSDSQCVLPSSFAFFQNVHLLAPAALLAGLICLLMAALVRAIPEVDPLDIEPDPDFSIPSADLTAFMRPANGPADELTKPSGHTV